MNQPEAATIWATVENSGHPEYGVVRIPFPIPRESYDSYIEQLQKMGLGDPLKQDCCVASVLSDYSILKKLEIMTVNVDELDYLAKRLESFDVGETVQFQAMAHKLELAELKDLINLTFCCQQTTVITDFSDLSKAGRDHYMNLHGGSALTEELEKLDGEALVRNLIDSGDGSITPYGVVYDNGMELEELYDGRHFPCYYYEPNLLTLTLCERSAPTGVENMF